MLTELAARVMVVIHGLAQSLSSKIDQTPFHYHGNKSFCAQGENYEGQTSFCCPKSPGHSMQRSHLQIFHLAVPPG